MDLVVSGQVARECTRRSSRLLQSRWNIGRVTHTFASAKSREQSGCVRSYAAGHQLKFWGTVVPLAVGGLLVGHRTDSVVIGLTAPSAAFLVGAMGGALLAIRDINRGG